MSEMEHKETEPPRKQLRQPPSVPFIWEERPGYPKKNWQPSLATFVPSPPLLPPPVPVPVKMVTSVPFRWEETPGKPLPASLNDTPQLPHPPLETTTTTPLPPPVPVPVKLVTSVPFDWEETPGQPYPCFVSFVDFNPPEPLDQPLPPPPMYGEVETSSDIFDDASSDSFSSVPSLLATNRSVSISGTVVAMDEFDDNLNRETSSMPSSPAYESDDSTSSYMTGASSLVGASFLEKLFPRLLPSEKVKAADSEDVKVSTHPLHEEVKPTTESDNMNIGFPVRTPQTLGELIMMSRRRSYMRRAVEMRKQKNLYREFTKNGADSCCLLVPGIKMIEGLEWKKYQPRLKLI
ncbi:PREDICTED: proline-rich receptor-like protein kinase PERK10 [Camelina sativa]|uniref:Proline-rich receptor-like protein kinase PERK10 n=1 Tax=Camelina sativa TaxID=90675 RepID=A0ABM0X933_CAMSA|nr:PREDICTED: proline-rich receptor-like protein kinase PERK10 [Camelina sativa]